MQVLKKEKGITMVTLVITVIVIIILSGVGINLGITGVKSVNDSKLKTELDMVQHAVLEQYTKYKTTKDASYLVGDIITNDEVNTIADQIGVTLVNIPSTYSNKDYYKWDKEILKSIGIQDSTHEYIINYISGEVINVSVKQLSNSEPLYIKAKSF